MANKFLIFMDANENFSIHLAVTELHRNIKTPSDAVCRCGGGYWSLSSDGALCLYDLSADFGKYNKEQALSAFKSGHVFYFGENCMEEWGLKELVLD